MTSNFNRQWILVRRPSGAFRASDFEYRTTPRPTIANGQTLIRNVYLSADPTQRIWVKEDSYFPMMPLNEVMWGIGMGVVEESLNPEFPLGTAVNGVFGMQDYAVSDGQGVTPFPAGVPLEAGLALFGHIGMTAYFGITDVGKAKAGETVLVSGAAGAVGSLAGQIAKLSGCRVVGIAGSEAKCQWLTSELGFDAAINYKATDVGQALQRHCPAGIDVYFENVGGQILDAALTHLNLRARIALCGMISDYVREEGHGITNLRQLIFKRARIEGFLVLDYVPRAAEAMDALGRWLQEGKLKYRVDWVDGLENAPTAINRLLEGANVGKVVIRVSEPPVI
jgi:NADPH-dependent curcumin reductase